MPCFPNAEMNFALCSCSHHSLGCSDHECMTLLGYMHHQYRSWFVCVLCLRSVMSVTSPFWKRCLAAWNNLGCTAVCCFLLRLQLRRYHSAAWLFIKYISFNDRLLLLFCLMSCLLLLILINHCYGCSHYGSAPTSMLLFLASVGRAHIHSRLLTRV